jgi:hypothetical protein
VVCVGERFEALGGNGGLRRGSKLAAGRTGGGFRRYGASRDSGFRFRVSGFRKCAPDGRRLSGEARTMEGSDLHELRCAATVGAFPTSGKALRQCSESRVSRSDRGESAGLGPGCSGRLRSLAPFQRITAIRIPGEEFRACEARRASTGRPGFHMNYRERMAA